MPEITEPLSDEELRDTAKNGWAPHGARLATELLAARAEMAALRNDLDAKRSDFEAAMERIVVLEKANRKIVDGTEGSFESFRAKQRQDAARIAELEAFVADLACHGLRVDTDPTRPIRSPEQRKADLEGYLRSADKALREDARRFVPDADRPHSAGRPRPAARVEVVAECATEVQG